MFSGARQPRRFSLRRRSWKSAPVTAFARSFQGRRCRKHSQATFNPNYFRALWNIQLKLNRICSVMVDQC